MKKRDYAAEYRRRIDRAQAAGYSKSVARGHPKRNEVSLRIAKRLKIPPQETALIAAAKQKIKRGVRRDKVRVFGSRVKRKRKVHPDTVTYEKFLQQKQQQEERKFDWTDEYEFVRQMMLLGFDEHEAYTLWFS